MPFPYSPTLLSRFLANIPSLLPEHEGCVSIEYSCVLALALAVYMSVSPEGL